MAKRKLPKRVLGVKLGKRLRKGPGADLLTSELAQQVFADLIVASILAAIARARRAYASSSMSQ